MPCQGFLLNLSFSVFKASFQPEVEPERGRAPDTVIESWSYGRLHLVLVSLVTSGYRQKQF